MLSLFKKEDWWANWLGAFFIGGAALGLIRFIPKLPKWTAWEQALPVDLIVPVLLWAVGLGAVTALALMIMGEDVRKYLRAFPAVFALAILSYLIGNQSTLAHYGFSDVIWALVLGMLISNLWKNLPGLFRSAHRAVY